MIRPTLLGNDGENFDAAYTLTCAFDIEKNRDFIGDIILYPILNYLL